MTDFFAMSGLINAIVATVFGLFGYFNNRKAFVNKIFALMNFSVALWSFPYFFWLVSKTEAGALFWTRALSFGAVLIPIFYLHWILTILEINKIKKNILFLGYGITFIFALLSVTPFFVLKVEPILNFAFWPKGGILYFLYILVLYLGFPGYGIYQLVRFYKTTSGHKKAQIKYLIIGSLVGFGAGITNFPLWFNIPFLPYGNILVTLYVMLFAIAMFRHHLMDIKVIATELLTSVVWLFLLVRVLLDTTWRERIPDLILLGLVIFFGVFLVRSVIKEVRSRERIEKMAKELEAANVELQKLDQAKSEFLNIASHQLRTPVSVIKGVASMMKEGDLERMPEEKRKVFIQGVWEKSQKLEEIIDDILDASEMASAKYQVSKEKAEFFDLTELLPKLLEDFQPLARERGIELVFEPPQGEIPKIYGQKEYLKEAINNLIDNAIKYTPSAQMSMEARSRRAEFGRVAVSLQKDGDNVIIKVSDNGIGIPPAELPELFQKFSRASNAKDMYTDGSGLGLFIVKEIVEGHGGRVWAESEFNQGSRFFINLPIKPAGETDIRKYIIEKQVVK